MLARPKSEVTFNFMFEFINRAANMTAPDTVAALDELMPYGKWRARLAEAGKGGGRQLTPDRKDILISTFTENLQQIGHYQYVVPTENPAAPHKPNALLPLLRHAARDRPSGVPRVSDKSTGCTGRDASGAKDVA
jgi:hypothetical protein